jgi:hypothetical protein
MCFVRGKKEARRLERVAAEVSRRYDPLADAWDSLHGLRDGDRAIRSAPGPTKKHPNEWDLGQTIRLAFTQGGAVNNSNPDGSSSCTVGCT